MKSLKYLVWFVYFFTFGLFAADILKVEITNIKKVKGMLNIAVFDSAKKFEASADVVDAALKSEQVAVNNKKMVFTYKDLPKGKYAVNVFQDMNGNGKVDTNFVGMPKEPFGFSKNFKPRFGPPDFKDVAFDYTGGEKTIKISLIQ